ncbi:UDP-N-acetylmuramate dehydrogenase [Bacteroides uniformis]|uniref:UDP-N-acetylmuramate dehydrogenase n=1 Tax=Bacteroides uniformis TaxID=820 RepID=UPI00189B88BB|nr:FAD-binding protein [Bacteroides uniformis]
MRVLKSVDLYKYNTMKLHSYAEVMYIPETVDELVELITMLKAQNLSFYCLGAGSNIIFAERVKNPIINLMFFDNSLCYCENDSVRCGASVRIQKLISWLKNYSLGGIEYLFSVPSSVGGAVYMNAGRGRKFHLSISDYIRMIDYLDLSDMKIKTLYGNEYFSYRASPFQKMDAVILNVVFKFKKQESEVTDRLIRERMEYSKKTFPLNKPSCGSIFNKVNPLIIRLFMGKMVGGAMFSVKQPNWISNMGNATAKDIENLVNMVIRVHRFCSLKYNLEIRFFK